MGSSVLEADAMTIMPLCQSSKKHFLLKKHPKMNCYPNAVTYIQNL
jgi:hypothetical protein